MNRKERRRLEQGKGSSSPRWGTKKAIDFTPVVRALKDRTQLTAKDYTEDFMLTRLNFDALLKGTACAADFDKVLLRLHMGNRRAKQIEGGQEGIVPIFHKALAAMQDCRTRSLNTGKFGFTGEGQYAMKQALETLEVIVESSTRAQMQSCWDETIKAMDAAIKAEAEQNACQ